MKRSRLIAATVAMTFAAALGFASAASAHGPGYYGPDPEHYRAMRDSRNAFDQKIQPLRQQFHEKQAELDALYDSGTPRDDPKVQSLMQELDALDEQIYAAHREIRREMANRGAPFYGGHRGPGYGGRMGAGCGGRGWHGGYEGHGYRSGGYGCGFYSNFR